jgi:hypothetical protein
VALAAGLSRLACVAPPQVVRGGAPQRASLARAPLCDYDSGRYQMIRADDVTDMGNVVNLTQNWSPQGHATLAVAFANAISARSALRRLSRQ